MIDEVFLRSLGILIVTAAVFVIAARAIRMPAIVVYLLAGVLIGPVLGAVKMSPALELISEAGIALLLFLVGLELSFAKIRDVGRVAVVAGIGQVVFTALGGFGLCWILNFTVMESLFLSTALTFSSTVVVVKLLDEKGELNSLYGRIAVGIFLVQDMVVIVILTFLAGLSDSEGMSMESVGGGVLKAFGGMGLMLGFVLLASKYLLPKPFRWASRSAEMLLIWALSWCFFLVWGAHSLGLSLEVGAFLAGLSLAQLPYNEDLHRRVHPLMNFCIAVFFVSLGIKMEVGEALAEWQTVLVLYAMAALARRLGVPFMVTLQCHNCLQYVITQSIHFLPHTVSTTYPPPDSNIIGWLCPCSICVHAVRSAASTSCTLLID
jgi:Kef-type K+ transport system membrane component KefB